MSTKTYTYHFENDPQDIRSFMRKVQTSTDAVNALEAWTARAAGRSYGICKGKDLPHSLDAQLTLTAGDERQAGHDLQEECLQRGLTYRYVPEA